MASQVLVNGLLLGGMLGLIGLGFSMVWGILNIVNLAHAAFIMLGAYLTFWFFSQWLNSAQAAGVSWRQ